MNNNKKQVLEKRLSLLIGFDGVSDLVEHCLSLETSEELSEFLTSLLGVYNDEIKRYCDDIAAFKSGRSLSSDVTISSSSEKEGKERKPVARELDYSIGKTSSTTKNNKEFSISSSSSSSNKKKNSRSTTKNNRNSKLENKRNNLKNRRNKSNPMEPVVKNDKKSNNNIPINHPHPKKEELKNPSTNNTTSTTAISDVTPTIQQQQNLTQLKKLEEKEESTQKKGPHQEEEEEKVEPLERGKAEIECGCFGTICKPLTNCLYCGRIQCEREGYGFCPYCGFRVSAVDYSSTSVLDSNGQKPKDILHKERLLKFDREFTQRTQIYNDDEDYFQNTSSKWLSQEEKVDAQTKDEEDRKGKHQRAAMTLKIDF